MRYEFTIESWTPTPLNKLIGCHWATKHRRRKSDDKNVAGFAWLAKIPHATGPRSVKLVIGLAKGQRGYDPDAYQKSALDALVNCGLLIDDSRKWCQFEPPEFEPVRLPRPRTTIILTDLS